ncbi:SpoIVB peptidase [Desulfallas thermosapovorans]|uniref:SpoIVB peptidase n=1 Tax=Desulfallas thermosapovorans TaxID=58137 RepID=UPI001FAA1074|nr:SpoIVB peptidase [Desulfallas thermosapovorans]
MGDRIATGIELPEIFIQNVSLNLRAASEIFSVDGNQYREFTYNPEEILPVALKTGQMEMQMKLFGLLPIHRMVVNVVDPPHVIPGGQSIGVLLHTEGVMVVGEAAVEKDGQTYYPARAAGISVGDLILQINGAKITSENQLQELVDKYGKQGKKISLLVKQGNKNRLARIEPILCDKTGRYRIGLFIKNSTAGVGTLTFYEPRTKTYGALGHMITDFESGHRLNPVNGKIVEAAVKGLHPGKKGAPGEKLGVFKGSSDIIGDIEKNTTCGIFGKLQKGIRNPYYNQPVPVAMKYQIKKGPAEILTVLDENKIERFNIEIEDILPADNQGKGMVIKVIDKRLLDRTGGIIQGMSGSPIIQNGRLVGAVTHVFINDPAKGYGVLAENMLKEANLLNIEHAERIAG